MRDSPGSCCPPGDHRNVRRSEFIPEFFNSYEVIKGKVICRNPILYDDSVIYAHEILRSLHCPHILVAVQAAWRVAHSSAEVE